MQDNSLMFTSSYDPVLVEEFKVAVPYADRRWDSKQKAWFIAAQHGQVVASLVKDHLGIRLTVPAVATTQQTITHLVKLEYLGAAKERGDGQTTASGWANGGWSLIFPLAVLRRWFEMTNSKGETPKPDAAQTLYSVLGVGRKAVGIDIKRAYRRAARTWHPDVCKEPDAGQQFIRVQGAYEILSDPGKRARYDAGLRLEAAAKKQAARLEQQQARTKRRYGNRGSPSPFAFAAISKPPQVAYRPPMRCGWLMIEGTESLGRVTVSRILQWEDIRDRHGQVLVTFWPPGSDHFEKRWVK